MDNAPAVDAWLTVKADGATQVGLFPAPVDCNNSPFAPGLKKLVKLFVWITMAWSEELFKFFA